MALPIIPPNCLPIIAEAEIMHIDPVEFGQLKEYIEDLEIDAQRELRRFKASENMMRRVPGWAHKGIKMIH